MTRVFFSFSIVNTIISLIECQNPIIFSVGLLKNQINEIINENGIGDLFCLTIRKLIRDYLFSQSEIKFFCILIIINLLPYHPNRTN